MSYDDAVAAIHTAVEADQAPPAGDQAPPAAPAVETPTGTEAPAEQPAPEGVEDSEPEHFFNPDDLSPDLVPAWKQLQAAFTRKTQELAAQRQQLDQFGDLEEVGNAVELYERLSDPNNWVQLHSELTSALQEQGFSFGEAQQMAADELETQGEGLGLDLDDPDLAPITRQLQSLQAQSSQQQAQLEEFVAQQEYQQQVVEAERAHQEYVTYMNQQVNGLRQAFPHYTDEDVRAVVELGSFYNDDLAASSARYEEIVSGRMERYLASKQGAASPTHAPAAGDGVNSIKESEAQTTDEVTEELVETLRRMQAAGDIDM
jgi:hypothetical protein